MPWSGNETFVRNKNSNFSDPSFISKRNPSHSSRERGLQLRGEFERLAGEIAVEKGVTLPPVHPFWEKGDSQ